MSAPTFVVGTGRCGSTMLSNMLREHPKILSISEFFALVTDLANSNEAFTSEAVSGSWFWSIVGGITPKLSFALRHQIPCPEWLYPCDSPAARFSRQTGVPNILATTLPHLTGDHDRLFDVLTAEVNGWPTGPIGEHYHHLFGWLAEYFGKRLWIERSGGGLGFVERLLPLFPNARFIHIARDGRDAAISMQKHPMFMLGVVQVMLGEYLGVDPFSFRDRTHIDRVPEELRPFLPERFRVDALDAFRFPLDLCGGFWTQQIGSGLTALSALPADRLLTLRYEDFFIDPKRQLDTLAAFLGEEFVDEAWSARCAASVRQPKSTWRDLPEEDAHALTEACRPGFEMLREAGVNYDL